MSTSLMLDTLHLQYSNSVYDIELQLQMTNKTTLQLDWQKETLFKYNTASLMCDSIATTHRQCRL